MSSSDDLLAKFRRSTGTPLLAPVPNAKAREALVPEYERVEPAARPLLEVAEELAVQEKGLEEIKRAYSSYACSASFSMFCREAWHTVEQSTTLQWSWQHEIICATLSAVFFDWLKQKRSPSALHYENAVKNVLFNVPPGTLKPVHVDGLVTTSRGLIRAGDVVVGDQVITHRGRLRTVTALSERKTLPTLTLETHRGRRVRTAYDHPVLTQRGWVEAGKVKLGDRLAEVHAEDSIGIPSSHAEARLIGYLIGDGCFQNGGASFTNQDPESVADFQVCASELGFDCSVRERSPSYTGSSTSVIGLKFRKPAVDAPCSRCALAPRKPPHYLCAKCCNERQRANHAGKPFDFVSKQGQHAVREWSTKHDLLDKNSFEKRVPKQIMQADEDTIAEYLAAYWACDGGIQDRRDAPRAARPGQKTCSVRIDATTVSEGLARDHLLLFQRLGLSFRLHRQVSKLSSAMVGRSKARVGDDYISWGLSASDQDTVAKFMEKIAPRIRHEKSRRAPGTVRTEFDATLHADEVVTIGHEEDVECVCFAVEEDHSFVYQGVAVHNSRIASVFFPAWVWIHDPSFRFIAISVNEQAAMRDARDMRVVLQSDWYQNAFTPQWKFKADQDAVSEFGNTKGGWRLSKASGSEIVGLRGDALIADDMNNPNDAFNDKAREDVNTLWTNNVQNRVNSLQHSLRIGIQQKTHHKDWSAFVLKRDGEWSPTNRLGWLQVVIPAEYDPQRAFRMPPELVAALGEVAALTVLADPRRIKGETIDPIRFPLSLLEDLRKQSEGTNYYQTQYLQRPSAEGGDMIRIEHFSYFSLDPGVRPEVDISDACDRPRPAGAHAGRAELVGAATHRPGEFAFDEVIITVDCAAKETQKGSQWGLVAMGRRGGRRYVLDNRTRRGNILAIFEVLKEMILLWGPSVILVEDKAAGPDLRIRLESEMNSGDLPPTAIESIKVATGKIQRLSTVLSLFRAGMVSFRDGATWLGTVAEELCSFPNFGTDDIVDSITQALIYWMSTEEDGGYSLVGCG